MNRLADIKNQLIAWLTPGVAFVRPHLVGLGEVILIVTLAIAAADLVTRNLKGRGAESLPYVAPQSVGDSQLSKSIVSRFDPFFGRRVETSVDAPSRAVNTESSIADLPETRLDITLVGISMDIGRDDRLATVRLPNGSDQSFRSGDPMLPGVRLDTIRNDGVVILNAGRQEGLPLRQTNQVMRESGEGAADGEGPQLIAARTADSGSNAGTRSGPRNETGTPPTVSDRSATVSTPPSATEHRVVADVSAYRLSRGLQFRPRGSASNPDGFFVIPQGNGVLFRALTLKPGDVLLSLNGAPTKSLLINDGLRRQLANSETLVLQLERNGQPHTITVERE